MWLDKAHDEHDGSRRKRSADPDQLSGEDMVGVKCRTSRTSVEVQLDALGWTAEGQGSIPLAGRMSGL